MPWRDDTTANKTIQAFFSTYFLDNLMYSIIEANPNLYIVVNADQIKAMPFDTNTLNFALPGLAQYYGWVNHPA